MGECVKKIVGNRGLIEMKTMTTLNAVIKLWAIIPSYLFLLGLYIIASAHHFLGGRDIFTVDICGDVYDGVMVRFIMTMAGIFLAFMGFGIIELIANKRATFHLCDAGAQLWHDCFRSHLSINDYNEYRKHVIGCPECIECLDLGEDEIEMIKSEVL